MKLLICLAAFAVAVVLLGSGCGDTVTDSNAYAEEQAAIVDFDDCLALQARFDGWYDNRGDFATGVASSAMQADYDRMRELSC